jgi:hypothetical protein
MTRGSSPILSLIGEMLSIVVLAITGRFIGFAQSTLESAATLSVERALSYAANVFSVFTRGESIALMGVVLAVAALIRISTASASRSVLLGLREKAGFARRDLSWRDRVMRFPYAVLYRGLSGIATLVGALALAICFRLFDPNNPIGFGELGSYLYSLASGITYGTMGALGVLFLLYGVALAIIGYVASPAILSLDEMASGCRPEPARAEPRAA